MSESYEAFQERVARIYAKSDAASRNPRQSVFVDRDGYLVIRSRKPRVQIPWAGLLMLAACFFMIKGAMIAAQGHDAYNAKVAKLVPESMVEQAGEMTLRSDPMSRWIANQILWLAGEKSNSFIR